MFSLALDSHLKFDWCFLVYLRRLIDFYLWYLSRSNEIQMPTTFSMMLLHLFFYSLKVFRMISIYSFLCVFLLFVSGKTTTTKKKTKMQLKTSSARTQLHLCVSSVDDNNIWSFVTRAGEIVRKVDNKFHQIVCRHVAVAHAADRRLNSKWFSSEFSNCYWNIIVIVKYFCLVFRFSWRFFFFFLALRTSVRECRSCAWIRFKCEQQ